MFKKTNAVESRFLVVVDFVSNLTRCIVLTHNMRLLF